MRLYVNWLFVLFLAFAGSSAAAAENVELGSPEFHASAQHPFGWRGDGSGHFPAATPVTEWSATKNVRWSADVGKSYSSPIITDKCVLVTSEPNWLICLNRADGKLKWKVEVIAGDIADPAARKIVEDYKPPKDGSGLAAATPLTDGANVYAVFANGIVRAFDLEGKPKWIAAIDADQNTGYGRSASPILVAGKLIVHMTNLYAFDPASGKQLWKNEDAKSSYGTPVGLKVGDVEVIVTPVGDVIRASDGKSLASDIGRTAHSSPISAGNGQVCFGENPAAMIRLDPAFKDQELWSANIGGEVFGSPIQHENTLFIATGAGELFAFDAAAKGSPDPLIDKRPLLESAPGATPAAYASLTLAGKYLFLNSNKGEIVVLQATREAKLIARNKLPQGTGASPVFSGAEMFIRDGEKLYCIAPPLKPN